MVLSARSPWDSSTPSRRRRRKTRVSSGNVPGSAKACSFAKLTQVRAHARAGSTREATAALVLTENLLDQARTSPAPARMAYYTHMRLATDATEIYRDLARPRDALAWSRRAQTMPSARYRRAVRIRLAVQASAHLHNGDLDQSLAVAGRSVDLLSQVRSARPMVCARPDVRAGAPQGGQARCRVRRAHSARPGRRELSTGRLPVGTCVLAALAPRRPTHRGQERRRIGARCWLLRQRQRERGRG
ncbi:sporulation protein [Streptomyces sp. SPB074]|nr:sporulation protein [Streptomyces sp. SPB074]